GTAPARPGEVAADDLVLRVERETVRRLARTGGILFTIRTYTRRLAEVTNGDERRLLIDQVTGMPDDIAAYKQLELIRPLLSSNSTD
ncbi:heme-dependent oxidative N-demethylase subunit alpha family protein, partial [Campylobacter coli]|uniref:heme-dependent oxidative N-demethylase subunit alpha family protein n=1 Tax=Campylobacter coli TaxID=195 RepID=UPI003F7B6A78